MSPRTRFQIIDEGPGAHLFVELSRQQDGFINTSVIFVNRPGLSDRLLHNHLIPRAVDQNSAIIFPLSISYQAYEGILTLGTIEQVDIKPKHIYKIEHKSQNESAEKISILRSVLQGRKNSRATPVVIVLDTLQKWSEVLEVQIRYLVQEASYLNLSIWIHAPLHLIPNDLLPTIGNIVVIWPSKNEIKLIAENLPAVDVELWGQKQPQGLFIYNKSTPNGWQFIELTSDMSLGWG